MIDSLNRLPSIPGIKTGTIGSAPQTQQTPRTTPSGQFGKLLDQQLNTTPLRFSTHAQSRLLARQIHLSGEQMTRLEQGVHQAAQKGAKDSLVMVDNLAFIVSVANRTVVTAVDGMQTSGNVFTQIDSAVIA